jgi:endonuclease/exonuclease/phosphatase family metal-dependent hydrolase
MTSAHRSPRPDQPGSLKLLSFNIHAGTTTDQFHHYVIHGWRQVFPHTQRVDNLDAIADVVAGYDMVALQEVDSGSLRSGFINQSRYIATHAGMPHWYHQANRKIGNMTFTGNGFIGRFESRNVEDLRLPGVVPGRGCLLLRFGLPPGLAIAVVHLSLGRRARKRQLAYLGRQLAEEPHLIVMGDFNAEVSSPEIRSFCEMLDLYAPTGEIASYPSWQPQRSIDHILVSNGLRTRDVEVIDIPVSDHRPVAVSLELPADLELPPPSETTLTPGKRGKISARGLYSSSPGTA